MVCGQAAGCRTYKVKEMMFGSGELFDYFVCSVCGCLQISSIPADMHRYYPAEYGAFKKPGPPCGNAFFEKILRKKRTLQYVYQNDLIGGIVSRLKPVDRVLAEYLTWVKRCHAGPASRILDVGCGNGVFLRALGRNGFEHLSGLDPYSGGDLVLDGGVRIQKKDIFAEQGSYDAIMFHHSLEHMPEPIAVMQKTRELLTDTGKVLVRIPTVSSYAWERYGVMWVQIDAPRHMFLPSLESLAALARRTGFRIDDIVYDSIGFQFWGSEQYSRGISLMDKRSYFMDTRSSIFTAEEIAEYERRSADLNKERRGDQLCIVLSKERGCQ